MHPFLDAHQLFLWPAYAVMAVLGACVGSFANVVIYRLPRGESAVRPRSRCPYCHTPLRWRHLVPLASYVCLGRRCAYCHVPIPTAYPLVEAAMAAVFVAVFHRYGWSYALGRYAVLVVLLVVAAEIDRRHGVIPNRLLMAGAVSGLALVLVPGGPALGQVLLASAASGGILLLVRSGSTWVLGYPGMGMGDVKLAATTALFLGWANLWVFYLAAVLGSLLGLAGLCTGRLRRTSRLPFAPFVMGGAVLHLFWIPPPVEVVPW